MTLDTNNCLENSNDYTIVENNIQQRFEWIKHRYIIQTQIGEGAFSQVFKAYDTHTNSYVAIKAISQTTAPIRILEELNILKMLGGQNICIPLIDVKRKNDQILAIFPLINGIDFKDFIKTSNKKDVQNYMMCLLKAVKHIHSYGYMHRDIKPSNFLYDMNQELGFLIDFGLVQKVKLKKIMKETKEAPILFFNSTIKPSRPPGYFEYDSRPIMKAPRAGTRGFRAPEILFKSTQQGTEIDIWSVGVIFLCILTNQYPFFISLEDMDGLVEIGIIFGHAKMRKAAKLYNRIWKSNIETITEEGLGFRKIIENLNPEGDISDDAIDLLEKLLCLDSNERITAEEAIKHKYFY